MATKPEPRYPWFKFFPADWQGDELLGTCSLGARGLLAELLCIMHRATPCGHLLINQIKPSDSELARVSRATVAEVRRFLRELLTRGVLSQTSDGTIFSRRMVRNAKASAVGRETGRRGGNPQLKPITATVNGSLLTEPLTGRDNTQKLEARSQKLEARRQQAGNGTADDRCWKFSSLYVSPKMHAIVTQALGPRDAKAVNFDALYEAAACDYAEHGEPGDKLDDLKKRARRAVPVFDPVPSVEETAARRAASERDWVPLTPEEKARRKAALNQGLEKAQSIAAEKHARREAEHRARRFGESMGTQAESVAESNDKAGDERA
jgi:hypothetical protein